MKKLLVANRGEIALRILRTARRMGLATVAVYSEADAQAPHVRYADEAYCIGPPPARDSYLRGEALIELCQRVGADALHPGYGFLSENAAFCRAVTAAGITFVGPPPEAMELMGSKIASKQAVKGYGVPLVPGVDHAIADPDEALRVAREVGLPVLIKASAGGGGKGMRVVEREADLPEQMQLAVSEALNAFGDGSVFIERYVSQPRHIEIQVLADGHGNVVHLFERECSIQRRHQKVIEEAPSALLTPELRERMGAAAVNVCRACGYVNAGTVEFLVDAQGQFYFLEMNTRLQVEHPVTELITGLDLVEQQLRVAQGEALAFGQQDLQIRGHAIEIRVSAEDPRNNFLPDTGTLHVYRPPQGEGIRLDSGYTEGMEVSVYYDPMLAKLIVHAPTRAAAIRRMIEAIDDFVIVGLETTLPFCRYVLEHPAFVSGQFDTGFVKEHFRPEALDREPTEAEAAAAALLGAAIWQDAVEHAGDPQRIAERRNITAWELRHGW